jgi:hypothetical protein
MFFNAILTTKNSPSISLTVAWAKNFGAMPVLWYDEGRDSIRSDYRLEIVETVGQMGRQCKGSPDNNQGIGLVKNWRLWIALPKENKQIFVQEGATWNLKQTKSGCTRGQLTVILWRSAQAFKSISLSLSWRRPVFGFRGYDRFFLKKLEIIIQAVLKYFR